MRTLFHLGLVGILFTALGASAQSSRVSTTPDVSTIVNRMQAAMANRNQDRAYTVTREYKLAPEDASKVSRVVAQVNALPSGKKDYTIKEGSGQAENVVRKVLDHETAPAAEHAKAELSPNNYDFAYAGTDTVDGHTCYVLQLTPKRDGKDLLNGKAWIDANNYLVRQVAGSPAKSPSWWIKDVQVMVHYREIAGLWLQDATQAVANVRLVGKHTLTERALNVQTDTEVAGNSELVAKPAPVRRNHRRVDPALLGAGVFQQH